MTTSYADQQRRYWGAPVPPHLKHGQATYVAQIYGCACKICLPSGRRRGKGVTPPAIRQKKSREKLRGTPVPPGTKHGVYTYKVYGCRCPLCQDAHRLQVHRHNNPWMYRPTRGRWTVDGEKTILCWPPAGAAPDWKCPHEEAA